MPIPPSTLVTDMVIQTPWAERRCRFYWEVSAPPTTLTHLEAICDRLMGTVAVNFKAIMTTQVFITRFEGRWYGTGTTTFEANSTVASAQGTFTAVQPNSGSDSTTSNVSDTLPDEACLIIQKRTGTIGRAAMGRWFVPGLSEQMQNAGEVDIEFRTLAKTLADTCSSSVTVSTGFSTILNPRHYNRKTNALMVITKCYALRTIGTRRDRRKPLRLSRL